MQELLELLPDRIRIRPGGLVVILFGLVPLIYSLFLASQSLFWLIKGVPATGTVVRQISSQDDKGNITYYPVISFRTASGTTITFQSGDGGNPPGYPVGATLPIRYVQDHPQNAQIADFSSLGLLPIFLFGVGLLFILVGLAFRKPGSRFSIRPIYVIGAIFLVVGFIFLIVGAIIGVQARTLEQHATASTTGTVIHCVYDNSSQGICIPTIRFTPANGPAVTFNPSSYSNNLKMGDSVSVRYNPADPNEALLTSSSDVGPFIFGGLGGLFFLLGLIIEIIAIRNRYRPDTGVRYTTDIDAGTQYATDIGTDVQYAQSTDIDADAQYATGIDTDVPYTTDIDAGAQYAQSAEIGVSYGSSIQVRASVVFFCIFLFLGIIFFGVGLILLNQSISFQRTATGQATGTIIHCDETTNTVKNSNGTTTTSTACSPTIRFATSEGRTIDFIPSESSSGFHVGQSIPVSYNPQAPQQAQISSFFGLWGFPIVFLGIGGIFLIVIAIFGFFMWRAARKRAIG